MSLDASNVLTLYSIYGEPLITLDPNTGSITLRQGWGGEGGGLTLPDGTTISSSDDLSDAVLSNDIGAKRISIGWSLSASAIASNEDSIAIGAATASGLASLALGDWGNASGSHSVAIGTGIASGDYSIAVFGRASGIGATSFMGSFASGDFSFSAGTDAHAEGMSSTAMGMFTTAVGECSIAMGKSTAASGECSTAMGQLTTAVGAYSLAVGFGADSGGNSSISMGYYSEAAGFASMAFGDNTRAYSPSSVALGAYNVGCEFQDLWIETDPLFEIGNGRKDPISGEEMRRNAITVLKNGKTTITHAKFQTEHPADGDFNDSNANERTALVVQGHADFQGKVKMQRQGDILMGEFGNPE